MYGCTKTSIIFILAVLTVWVIYHHRITNTVKRHTAFVASVDWIGATKGRNAHSVLAGRKLTFRWPNRTYYSALQPWIAPLSSHQVGLMKRLPQVICIGVQHCGTEAFHRLLRSHPKIRTLQTRNEGNFFISQNYSRGLDYYKSLMEESTEDDIVYETSPGYFESPTALSRIVEWNKGVKLIVIMCDPVTLTFSAYEQMKRDGLFPNSLGFNEYVDASMSDLNEIKNGQYRKLEYGTFDSFVRNAYNEKMFHLTGFTQGMFSIHLNDWYTHFPINQIHIINGEQLTSNLATVMDGVQRFIGTDMKLAANKLEEERGDYVTNTENYKFRSDARKIPEKTLQRLSKFYKPYNEELYELLNKRFDWL